MNIWLGNDTKIYDTHKAEIDRIADKFAKQVNCIFMEMQAKCKEVVENAEKSINKAANVSMPVSPTNPNSDIQIFAQIISENSKQRLDMHLMIQCWEELLIL